MKTCSRPGLFLRSFFLQSGFGDERRQALGFAWALDPALRAAYAGDAAGLKFARLRALAPFNCQPHASGLVLGLVAELEGRAASGDGQAAARAVALKTAVGAALSASADAFFWGALRPLAGALAILVGASGRVLGFHHPLAFGAALGLLAFNLPALAARWYGVDAGAVRGEGACVTAAGLPVRDWTRAVRWAAVLVVVGAALASLELPFVPSRAWAAASFALGAGASAHAGGALRLVAAAGILGMIASAAGWLS